MSFIVAHYDGKSYFGKGYCYEYMTYMYILFICKQVFEVE
jgi:hypothetical protein